MAIGTWSWTEKARAVAKLKGEGLTNEDIVNLVRSDGRESIVELAKEA